MYGLLEELELGAYLSVTSQGKRRDVTLTPAGATRASKLLDQLPAEAVDYMGRASRFVVAKSTRTLMHITDRADSGSSTSSRLRLRKKRSE